MDMALSSTASSEPLNGNSVSILVYFHLSWSKRIELLREEIQVNRPKSVKPHLIFSKRLNEELSCLFYSKILLNKDFCIKFSVK